MFKEIDLSEKRGTGISKILRELRKNGSPEPEFEMDDDRNYLITIIPIHAGFKNKVSDKVSDKEKMLLDYFIEFSQKFDYVTTKMLVEVTEMGESTVRRHLNKFCEMNIIEADGKNKGTKYYLKDWEK